MHIYRTFLSLLLLGVTCQLSAQFASNSPQLEVILEELKPFVACTEKVRVMQVKGRKKISYFDSSSLTIYVEEAAIKVAKSFKDKKKIKGALAFLVGHELAHFSQGCRVGVFPSVSFVQNQPLSSEKIEVEREADVYGSFFVYAVGEKDLDFIAEFLEKLYAEYKLESLNNPDYPSLKERIEIGISACHTASRLADVFEMGQYLMALGQYSVALECWEYLAQYLRYPELSYNLGLANFMLASKDSPYTYPLLLAKNPIDRGSLGMQKKTSKDYIESAIYHFSEGIKQQHPFQAQLGLSCTYIEGGQYDLARKALNSAKSMIDTVGKKQGDEKALILIAEAILAARTKKDNIARQELRKSILLATKYRKIVRYWCNCNRDILDGKPSRCFLFDPGGSQNTAYSVDDININKLEQPHSFRYDLPLTFNDQTATSRLKYRSLPNSSYYYYNQQGRSTIVLQRISNRKKSYKGLSINSSRSKVETLLGKASDSFRMFDGSYFVSFASDRILFKFSKYDLVQEWAFYGRSAIP